MLCAPCGLPASRWKAAATNSPPGRTHQRTAPGQTFARYVPNPSDDQRPDVAQRTLRRSVTPSRYHRRRGATLVRGVLFDTVPNQGSHFRHRSRPAEYYYPGGRMIPPGRRSGDGDGNPSETRISHRSAIRMLSTASILPRLPVSGSFRP